MGLPVSISCDLLKFFKVGGKEMRYIFNLQEETPAKKNSRITLKNGMTIPSKNYREWHSRSLFALAGQTKPVLPISEPCHIRIVFTHGDLRRRDSDNGTSSIMDLLVDAKILSDDNWQIVREISIQNQYEKGTPHCSVTIMGV